MNLLSEQDLHELALRTAVKRGDLSQAYASDRLHRPVLLCESQNSSLRAQRAKDQWRAKDAGQCPVCDMWRIFPDPRVFTVIDVERAEHSDARDAD
jgi:hypothetical protein